MSYLVSARRWRPQTFADLVGQEHIARALTNAIRTGRVAHAFLFAGVRGVGKTTTARLLAKALNCVQGPTATPCNACNNCQEITAGTAVDVLEIDGASNTGVDDVREIIENVRYQAAKSRFKIYIIDEVHMLSNSAFNALLKTLEEPPAHVKFIFATTDPQRLPATVLSRCQRYDFRRIPLPVVVGRLRQIVAAEQVKISERALFILAREGEGSMRDAQSLLDQVLAAESESVSDQDVLDTLGIADRQLVYDVGDAIIARDARRTLELVDDVYRHGHDLRRFTRDVLEHFRNLAVAKATDSAVLPDIPEEEQAALRRQVERFGLDDCDRAFRILLVTDDEVARSPYPKLVLEMALIKLATAPPLLPVDELLTRVEEVESRLRRSGAPAPAAPRTQPGQATPPARERPPTVSATTPPATAAREATAAAAAAEPDQWGRFVAFVGAERATLAHHLEQCELARLDARGLEILAPKGFYFDYLSRADHVKEVEDLARRFFGSPVALRVSAATAPNGRTAKAPAEEPGRPGPELTDAALGNPVVRAAVEILGGQVQEVRVRKKRRVEEQ